MSGSTDTKELVIRVVFRCRLCGERFTERAYVQDKRKALKALRANHGVGMTTDHHCGINEYGAAIGIADALGVYDEVVDYAQDEGNNDNE